MRAAKVILGLGLVVLAAWAARQTSALFTTYDRFRPRVGSGEIVRQTVFFHHHALSGWQVPAVMVVFAVCALGFFLAGCWLVFSIIREGEKKGKG